jgi:HEPN domain-containing protein
MPPKRNESLYPKDWFRIAGKDFKRAEHLLGVDDPEGAGYHLQQAVEKYLKGFLLSRGWELKRIHDLEVLLNDALKYEGTLEQFRSFCQRVTGYYIIDRYPLPSTAELTNKEVQSSMTETEKFINSLRALTK